MLKDYSSNQTLKKQVNIFLSYIYELKDKCFIKCRKHERWHKEVTKGLQGLAGLQGHGRNRVWIERSKIRDKDCPNYEKVRPFRAVTRCSHGE